MLGGCSLGSIVSQPRVVERRSGGGEKGGCLLFGVLSFFHFSRAVP